MKDGSTLNVAVVGLTNVSLFLFIYSKLPLYLKFNVPLRGTRVLSFLQNNKMLIVTFLLLPF